MDKLPKGINGFNAGPNWPQIMRSSLALPTRMAGDTPSLDFILSPKSILRLREINEHPFSTVTRDPGIALARMREYIYMYG